MPLDGGGVPGDASLVAPGPAVPEPVAPEPELVGFEPEPVEPEPVAPEPGALVPEELEDGGEVGVERPRWRRLMVEVGDGECLTSRCVRSQRECVCLVGHEAARLECCAWKVPRWVSAAWLA